jgi:hypothetical protein
MHMAITYRLTVPDGTPQDEVTRLAERVAAQAAADTNGDDDEFDAVWLPAGCDLDREVDNDGGPPVVFVITASEAAIREEAELKVSHAESWTAFFKDQFKMAADARDAARRETSELRDEIRGVPGPSPRPRRFLWFLAGLLCGAGLGWWLCVAYGPEVLDAFRALGA